MKYMCTARPGPLPPSPEQFDAALEWLQGELDNGTLDCLYGFLEGGGVAIANADSHAQALQQMTEYPLYGLVTWEVKPLLAFGEGDQIIRAKLAEAQAAMGRAAA
jgi:hypothetical protein